MENFETAREVVETSANSAGSAMKEHAKWSESLEARLNKLKATWQGLSQAFLSSDFLKGVLDGVIALVNGLTKLIDTIGTIPTLAGIFVGFKGITQLPKLFKAFKNTQIVGGITRISDVLRILSNAFPGAAKGASLLGSILSNLSTKFLSFGNGAKGIKGVVSALGGLVKAHPIIAGITIAITALTAAFTYQKKKAEELAQSVEKTVSSYKDQHGELMKLKNDYDTSNEKSMISQYENLSRGVDGLGRNISLTADEYSEYQGIVNSIAEQIPSLVSGYDEQGNAILSCKGNVEQLTEAYEKLIHAQNNDVLSKAGDIEKDFANTLKESEKSGFWGNKTTIDDIEALEHIYEKGLRTEAEISSYLNGRFGSTETADLLGIAKAMEEAGVDGADGFWGTADSNIKALEKQLKEDPTKVKAIIDDYYAQFNEAIEEQKTIAQAKLSEAFDVSSVISGLEYGNINEELQEIAYQTVNSFDYDFLSNLSESGKSVEQWTAEMLNQLNSISESDNAQIEAAFDLQTKFNGGDISYGEYVNSLKDVQTTIDDLNLKSEAKEQLEISLGLDEGGIVEQYEALVKRLTDSKNYDFDISESEARSLLDGLSSEELAVAVDVITDLSNNNYSETAEEIRTSIERELALKGLTFDPEFIKIETAKLESLSTALSESLSGSGLAEESLSAVEGMFSSLSSYDPSKLFERTAHGIRLNSTELSRLNSEYRDTNLAELNGQMNSLGDIYNQTREELYRLTYGTDEYNTKAGELSTIEARINELEKLSAQYEGLASAYQQWQMVESAGNQRDMYETVLSGFETVEDELSRGWADDGTVKFLELITGQTDLAGKSAKELKEIWNGLDDTIKNTSYSVRDFFTVDDEGNSTSKGVYNFLDAVGQLEEEAFGGKDVVQRDDKGNVIGFDFQIVGGDEVIAEALGISEELVQIMVRAADDAGFVVSMDGTYQQLDVLREKAQEASESLNKILEKNGKKGFDFNFNSSDVDDITKQLGEAQKILDTFRNTDGTINTKLEGADEALTVASTLQSILDKLTRPAYMDIEVSQVEDDIQEPLRQLQELTRLTETEHQLKLSGADTSQLEESKQEVYDYFENLDPEVKAKIGLVDKDGNPLTGNALKDKLNSGDLAIEATVDIQMKMDDKLGILVDKALLDAGIIDGKEFEKRVDVYLNADVDNEDAKAKTEQAVKEVTGGKDGKSSSKDDKSSGDKVEKAIDVEVKTDEVDTSDVKDKTEKAVKEESSEKLAVETTVELETTIEEATELIQSLENADKDIVIDVTIKGLDDVKELNTNLDLATKIDGKVDNLNEFVKGAKELSKLDENISTHVTANIAGNVTDKFEYKIDNLKVFADGAKDLKGVGSFTSNITANVNGNVIDKFEYKLDNLKLFAEGANDLKNVGTVTANVTANVEGDVTEKFEYKLDNLELFAKGAKALQGIESKGVTISANVDGDVTEKFEYKLDNLKLFAEGAEALQNVNGKDVTIKAEVQGDVTEEFEYKLDNLKLFAQGAEDLQNVNSKSVTIKAEVKGDVTEKFEYKLDNLELFSKGAKALQDVDSKNVTISANVEGDVTEEFEYKLNNLELFADGAKALSNVESKNVTITAEVNGDVTEEFEYKLDNLNLFAEGAKALSNVDSKDITIKAEVEGDVTEEFEYKLDNLKLFSEGAKELQGINSKNVTITAEVDGNVVNTKEYKLDNLKVYTDNAKDISKIGTVTSKVTADVDGNVISTKEYKIDNLKAYTDSAKNVKSIGTVTSKVVADVDGNVIDTKEYKIDNLKVYTDSAKSVKSIGTVTSKVTADIGGNVIDTREGKIDNLKVFGESASKVKGIGTVTSNVIANVNGNVINTGEEKIDNLGVFATNANKAKGIGNFTSSVSANVSGNVVTDDTVVTDLEHFVSVVSGLPSQAVNVSVTANVDSANINQAITLLTTVANSGLFKNYSATVQVGAVISTIDDSKVQGYTVPQKEGTVTYNVDSSKVDAYKAPPKTGKITYSPIVKALTNAQKNKTGTITYKAKVVGFPVVNGTANANGTTYANGTIGKAYKQGDWGAKRTETALTGELGPELVVYRNRYWTVGDNGAEFATIPRGAIVFNHKQTEELFKNGRVTSDGGRGRALAEGNAFSKGSGGGFWENESVTVKADKVTVNSSSSTSSSSSSSKSETKKETSNKKSSSKEAEEEFEETIDWIEIAIDRLERAIDQLDTKASSVYRSWSERNYNLGKEISKVSEEIALQQKAQQKYLDAANAVGLDSSWVEKIKNGEIDIETITDETLKEKIDDFRNYYEASLDCKDAILELQEQEAELYQQRFDNVSTQYEGMLSIIEHEKNMLEEYINQSEAQGLLVSGKYYEALIDNEDDTIFKLKAEKDGLLEQLQTAMESGTIDRYSENWYEMVNAIDEITLSIKESETQIKEWEQTIQQLSWEKFDILQDRISAVTEEADFLIELLSSEKLFDDKGKFTDEGMATAGLHGQNYNTYMYQADLVADEIKRLEKEMSKDSYDNELEEHYREMISLQQEYILSAQEEKEAIRDLVSDGIEAELDALQDLIDKKNEALESEKDLYDYQRKISDINDEIAILEKQEIAFRNDNSEEGQQKRQQISEELENARQEREEAEFDRLIENTQKITDELYNQYSEILNTRLDNLDALVSDMIAEINADASSISATLTQTATDVGYTLSDSMSTIWDANSTKINEVITTYGSQFTAAQTTTNTALGNIKTNLDSIISQLNKIASTNVKSASTSSSANSKEANTTKKPTTTTTNNKPTTNTTKAIVVGGKINAGSAQIYDYAGDTSGERQYYRNDPIYTVLSEKDGYIKVRYHKLSSGATGWFKKSDVKAYASGKHDFLDDEIAWTQEKRQEFIVRPSDGAILTPIAKGDSVLNANASRNIWDMANSPAEFIKDNLNLGNSDIPNNSTIHNNNVQNFENIVFSMPNVKNYNELIEQMQKDRNFERLILSMSIDRLAGKSSLAKGKAVR